MCIIACVLTLILVFFFFNDTATTEIYTLSLHDALPIFRTSAASPLTGWSGAALPCWGGVPDVRRRAVHRSSTVVADSVPPSVHGPVRRRGAARSNRWCRTGVPLLLRRQRTVRRRQPRPARDGGPVRPRPQRTARRGDPARGAPAQQVSARQTQQSGHSSSPSS